MSGQGSLPRGKPTGVTHSWRLRALARGSLHSSFIIPHSAQVSILVDGSMFFDSIETPPGKVERPR
jgi:hypothetical protein